jgi:chemotaxis protein CheX
MSNSVSEVKPYGAEEFLSPENLEHADAVVIEIFKLMLGFDIQPMESGPNDPTTSMLDDRTAIVGFSGTMRGSCHVRVSAAAAQSIASAMLGGVQIEEEDESINDAVGEVCNMLAGGWKNGIPGLSSECSLSPPTVISGSDYKVHMSKPSVNLARNYRFEAHTLCLTLCREEAGQS